MPVTAPPLKATSRAADTPLRAVSATRVFARTETFMPMKPADAERVPPIRKPMPVSMSRTRVEHREHDRHRADDLVLAREVRAGALLNRPRDGLHLRVAGRLRE